jgi:hypothetical protein
LVFTGRLLIKRMLWILEYMYMMMSRRITAGPVGDPFRACGALLGRFLS